MSSGRAAAWYSSMPADAATAAAARSFWAANAAPALSMVAAAVILVVPLLIFTGIDRGWFKSEAALGPRDVRIELTNFKIAASRNAISAGDVNLIVEHPDSHTHAGSVGERHDLVVMRKNADGTSSLVARSDMLHMGDKQQLTLNLEPGRYELLCDVVEEYHGHQIVHAAEGMQRPFVVTAS